MNRLLLISSIALASFGLIGCNSMNTTMNDTSRFANSAVGTGVKYTATTVGTGVGYVSKAGAKVGKGVGSVVETGVNTVSGKTR